MSHFQWVDYEEYNEKMVHMGSGLIVRVFILVFRGELFE